MPIASGVRLGPYEVLAPLGAGGMGEVYRARDTRLDRVVAIKVLPGHLSSDPALRARFAREARAVSALSHPNICTLFDVGQQDDTDFLVMEFVEGEPLSSLLRRTRLEPPQVVALGVEIADALHEAHQHGIIHRDVKPQNIIVTPRGHAKVLDFGLAKAFEAVRPDDDTHSAAMNTREGTLWAPGLHVAGAGPRRGRRPAKRRVQLWRRVVRDGDRAPRVHGQHPARDAVGDPHRRARSDRPRRARPRPRAAAHRRQVPRERPLAAVPVAPRRRHGPGAAARWSRGAHASRDGGVEGPRPACLVGASVATGAWYWRGRGTPAARGVQSLAVLPLKPLAGDLKENYVGLGISDAIIARISQAGGLTVRPTSAVRRYATTDTDALAAAKEQLVDAVLEGSWQREGDRLRVSVNLLRQADGASLWADRFDVRAADIFAVQDQVSERLVSQLRLQLSPDRQARVRQGGTTNARGVRRVPEGAVLFRGAGIHRGHASEHRPGGGAVRACHRARSRSSRGHAMLGFALAWTAIFIEDNPALIARAKALTDRAEELDAGLAQVHRNRAFIVQSKYEGGA